MAAVAAVPVGRVLVVDQEAVARLLALAIHMVLQQATPEEAETPALQETPVPLEALERLLPGCHELFRAVPQVMEEVVAVPEPVALAVAVAVKAVQQLPAQEGRLEVVAVVEPLALRGAAPPYLHMVVVALAQLIPGGR